MQIRVPADLWQSLDERARAHQQTAQEAVVEMLGLGLDTDHKLANADAGPPCLVWWLRQQQQPRRADDNDDD